MPEVVEHGRTGFIVADEAGALAAVSRLHELPRGLVRAVFETRFTARRMAEDYLEIYQDLLAGQRGVRHAKLQSAAE